MMCGPQKINNIPKKMMLHPQYAKFFMVFKCLLKYVLQPVGAMPEKIQGLCRIKFYFSLIAYLNDQLIFKKKMF